jgi:hypothetical protein
MVSADWPHRGRGDGQSGSATATATTREPVAAEVPGVEAAGRVFSASPVAMSTISLASWLGSGWRFGRLAIMRISRPIAGNRCLTPRLAIWAPSGLSSDEFGTLSSDEFGTTMVVAP